MGEHKYREAYSRGFRAGQDDAFSTVVYECLDEMPPLERAVALQKLGATLKVDYILDDIISEIKMYQADGELGMSEDTDEECRQCARTIFESVYKIIEKHKSGKAEECKNSQKSN